MWKDWIVVDFSIKSSKIATNFLSCKIYFNFRPSSTNWKMSSEWLMILQSRSATTICNYWTSSTFFLKFVYFLMKLVYIFILHRLYFIYFKLYYAFLNELSLYNKSQLMVCKVLADLFTFELLACSSFICNP